MHEELFFLVTVMDHDFVTEATFSGDGSGQAMESWEKLTSLYAGIDLKIDFVSFLKLLEVLA